MLKAELEDLIRTSLNSLGATEMCREDGILRYHLAGDLSERLGRADLSITFNSSVASHKDDVELISAGTFMYDLILRLVKEKGRVATGWLYPSPAVDPPSLIVRAATRLQGRRLTRLKTTWDPIYLFTYRLGFYFDTPHEKLYTIRVDHGLGRVRHELHPSRLLDDARTNGPEPGLETPKVEPEKAFRLGWGKVEEEVARLTEKYQHQGDEDLKGEILTIEKYYRQLIEEEKRARQQKNTRTGREESDERIELLKLEWDRRIAEENSRFSPEVSVILSCAACLYAPVEKWRANRGSERRETAADFWVDMHSGEAWPARPLKRAKRRSRDGQTSRKAESEPGDSEAPESGEAG